MESKSEKKLSLECEINSKLGKMMEWNKHNITKDSNNSNTIIFVARSLFKTVEWDKSEMRKNREK